VRRLSSPAFVGRSDELAAIEAALARADAGEAGAVFISGEAGVGKTRFVSELARLRPDSEMRFLVGGCVEMGGSELPYAPLLGALQTLVRGTEPRVLDELIGPAREDLGRLMPELQSGRAASEAVDPLAQGRLFQALLGLFARAAPLTLVIEDLHWADPSTRGFLSFLVRNMGRERLLLVATYRSDELHRRHPLRQFLAEVERLPVVERLELSPFSQRELAQQLTAILDGAPEPALVEELFARSQGNAFFAEELLAASGEDAAQRIPESLRDALTLRVERLSPQARQLARSAAVAGSVVGHGLLVATAGLGDDELAGTLREAIENNLLVQDPANESYAFRHELLREAVYDEVLPGERVALHAKLARALENDPGLAVGAHGAAAQRAMHWSAAHELPAALEASVQAGIEAEQVWSFAEANSHFENGIELWSSVAAEERPKELTLLELYARAAEAAYLSGQDQRALTLARNTLEQLAPDRDPLAAGLARARLARYLLVNAELLDALAEYRTAAALLPQEPSAARAAILAGEAHILMLQGEAMEARAPSEEAIRIAREVGATEAECDALNTFGAVLSMLGDAEGAIDVLRSGQKLATEAGAHQELLRAYINLGQSLDDAGRLAEAAEVALDGWRGLRPRIGSAAVFLAAEAGLRLTRLGRWDEALALLEEAAQVPGSGIGAGLVLAALAWIDALRGELDRASAHIQAATPMVPTGTAFWFALARPEAELALGRGHHDKLREMIDPDEGLPHTAHSPFLVPVLVLALKAEAELAELARAGGDGAAEGEAVRRAQALLTRARALIAPEAWPLGTAPRETLLELDLCEVEAKRASGEARAEDWAADAARWEELGRPPRVAYARLREAEAALREDLPRARVVDALAAARSTASRLGARLLLDEIEALSRRARIRTPSQEGDAPSDQSAGLTARELDVLRLITEGRTNREIGATLYMSPKTASVHVSRILAKLDVKSRTEAAGVAHQLGLLGGSDQPRDRSSRA